MIGTGTSGASHVLFKDRYDASTHVIEGLKVYCQKPIYVIHYNERGCFLAAATACD